MVNHKTEGGGTFGKEGDPGYMCFIIISDLEGLWDGPSNCGKH